MISRRGRALQLGVSEAMLRRHEAMGTIWPEDDGTWDIEATRARLKASQNPAREEIEAVGQARSSRGVKVAGEERKASVAVMTFNEARAVNENLKAARLKLELAELEGRLIDRGAVLVKIRDMAQQERDAILSWPARAAPLLAAELNVDPHALHAALDASLRTHLTARASVSLEV